MEPGRTVAYANQIRVLRQQEIEFYVNMAKFVANARVAAGAEEVRG